MPELKDRTGEVRIMHNGLSAKIVKYRNGRDMDIEFENGDIAIKKCYLDFKNGKISCPLQFDYIDDYAIVTNPNLTPNFSFIIDFKDIPLIVNNYWYQHKDGYAVCNISRKKIRLHRLITNAPYDMEVDHINGNKLDNRNYNLRICTKAENQRNRSKQSNNSSGYKGVSWHKGMNKWTANIGINGKREYIGSFSDKDEAARAYNQAAIKHHGEFAKLNLIE